MGKVVVFLPIIIFFGIFFLLILGFFGVVVKLIKKSKAIFWTGTLADKKVVETEDMDDRPQTLYTLIFKTEEGKEIKVGVSRKDFDSWKIGDKAEKRKGELRPRKV